MTFYLAAVIKFCYEKLLKNNEPAKKPPDTFSLTSVYISVQAKLGKISSQVLRIISVRSTVFLDVHGFLPLLLFLNTNMDFHFKTYRDYFTSMGRINQDKYSYLHLN